MANLNQTMEQLSLLFADFVSTLTGLDENKVLLMYDQRGKGSQNINTNVAYVNVTNEVDDNIKFKNRTKEFNQETNEYTFTQQASRTINLKVVFYGPNCQELAQLLNEKIYFESSRHFLAKNYLSLIPSSTDGPTYLPELYNAQWFKRCDINLKFYNTISVEEVIPAFENANITTIYNK